MYKQMGYLVVDHRASPGLPEEVAVQYGYDPKLCREGKMYEADTLTCSICRGTVVKNPNRTRERHSCKVTGHYICDGCAYLQAQPDYVYVSFDDRVDHLKHSGSPLNLLKGT